MISKVVPTTRRLRGHIGKYFLSLEYGTPMKMDE
jgi:hypothetical protein